MISLWTAITPQNQRCCVVIDAKICNMVNILPLDNPLGALEETPYTPLCLTFALSYQQ